MANRLVLHIGTEKTGSTAIQRFLQAHREWLDRQGHATPATLGKGEHRRFPLLFYQQDQHDDLTLLEGLDDRSADERADEVQRWRHSFELELTRKPGQTWLISSEHIHSRLLHDDRCMASLLEFCQPRFESMQIIVYLRDPLSAALSLWSTAVLNGADLAELPMPDNSYWNRLCCHRTTLERLERWFPGRFQPRLFTPECWRDGDIIRDFCAAAGLALPDDYHPAPERANATLSWLSLSLIARLNRQGKPSRQVVQAIRHAFDHLPPPTARAWQRRAYAAAYAGSNEWVRCRHFASRSSLFDAPPEQDAP
jgi:hypothetical protein